MKLIGLYQESIDRIRAEHTVGKEKAEISWVQVYTYDILCNKTNYELTYRVEHVEDKIIVVIMAGAYDNFYAV